MRSAQEKVNLLARLPSPPQQAPGLDNGHVRLYEDGNWTSKYWEFSIRDGYEQKKRHRVRQDLFDRASRIAFNLPVGTVLTFMNDLPGMPGNFADLSNAGSTVDLVGTGRTEGVRLDQLNMDDKVSTFFWREVDLNIGAIELFDNQDFQSNRVTIFLSEWEPNKIHSIQQWWIKDRTTSVRWLTLDRETVELFDNPDGQGAVQNINGSTSEKQITKLQDWGFNDRMSAFRWNNIRPEHETIQPITISKEDQQDSDPIRLEVFVDNNNDEAQSMTPNFSKKQTISISTSTTDSFATSINAEYSASAEAGIGIAKVTVGWKVAVDFKYDTTTTRSTTTETVIDLGFGYPITVPPHSRQYVSAIVNTTRVNSKTYTTKAERWYKERLDGCYRDKDRPQLWKRDETVQINVAGSLRGAINVVFGRTEKL